MLARLQRSLAFTPRQLGRYQFSTTPRRRSNESQAIDSEPGNELDKAFDWEKPLFTSESEGTTTTTTEQQQQQQQQQLKPSESAPASVSAPAIESSKSKESNFSNFLLLSTKVPPPNGLSYTGLPEHKIFLDIPPAQDPLIRYLASSLLHDGRRHTAERRASRVLLHLHTLTRSGSGGGGGGGAESPLPLLRQAIEKVIPSIRIARHKHSTKIIEIPVALNEKQQVRYAMKWLLHCSDRRGGRSVEERLAREIILVLNGSSKALESKHALHSNAMVNRGNIPVGRGVSI